MVDFILAPYGARREGGTSEALVGVSANQMIAAEVDNSVFQSFLVTRNVWMDANFDRLAGQLQKQAGSQSPVVPEVVSNNEGASFPEAGVRHRGHLGLWVYNLGISPEAPNVVSFSSTPLRSCYILGRLRFAVVGGRRPLGLAAYTNSEQGSR